MNNTLSIIRRSFCFAAVTSIFLLAADVHSQTNPPQSDSETPPTTAYIRPWIMLPPEVPPKSEGEAPTLKSRIDLIYSDETGGSRSLVSQATPFSMGGYMECPPSKTELRLVKVEGNTQVELAQVSAPLRKGAFCTVIALKDQTGYRLSVIDDTPKPPPPSSPDDSPPPPEKTIVFFNFLPGPPAEVGSQNPAFSRTVPFGVPVEVKEMPKKIFSVMMPVLKRKKKQLANFEVDLLTNDSVSFIISQDIYGRTGAAIMPNGKVE